VKGADSWSGLGRTHSRDALLHDQFVTGDYWERHGLEEPDAPLRFRGVIDRLRLTGVPDDRASWVTLRDLLSDVPKPTKTAPDNWPNHVHIPGARTYAKHTGSPLDLPSKTIKAGVHGVAGGEAMIRELSGKVRYLTVREAALVQGFPRDYEFPGPRSRVMGVIGNAVAVTVAAAIGLALREHTHI
jgi:DNA (cytosine-5)-methyltransferase 1